MTLEDMEALLENIDFMTIIYGLFEFEESGTLTISGWSKNLRTNLGYDTSDIYTVRTVNDVLEDRYPFCQTDILLSKKISISQNIIDGPHCA